MSAFTGEILTLRPTSTESVGGTWTLHNVATHHDAQDTAVTAPGNPGGDYSWSKTTIGFSTLVLGLGTPAVPTGRHIARVDVYVLLVSGTTGQIEFSLLTLPESGTVVSGSQSGAGWASATANFTRDTAPRVGAFGIFERCAPDPDLVIAAAYANFYLAYNNPTGCC